MVLLWHLQNSNTNNINNKYVYVNKHEHQEPSERNILKNLDSKCIYNKKKKIISDLKFASLIIRRQLTDLKNTHKLICYIWD